MQKPFGGGPDLLDGGVERLGIGGRRSPETADLADELERCGPDLVVRELEKEIHRLPLREEGMLRIELAGLSEGSEVFEPHIEQRTR